VARDKSDNSESRPWNRVVVDEVLRRWMLGRSKPDKIQVDTVFLSMGAKFRFRQVVAPRRPRGKFRLGRLGPLKVATLRVAPGTLQLEAALAVAGRTEVENVLAFGSVSALEPELKVGDLVLATSAVPGEGLSDYYDGPSPAEPDAELLEFALEAASAPLAVKEGLVHTTASLARLTEEFLDERRSEGAVGIDTSTSALFRVAPHFDLAALAVLVVSDNPTTGEMCLVNKNLMTRYERGLQKAFALLAEVAKAAAPEGGKKRRGLGRLRLGGGKDDD
jgi:nucleoside phosphorylase